MTHTPGPWWLEKECSLWTPFGAEPTELERAEARVDMLAEDSLKSEWHQRKYRQAKKELKSKRAAIAKAEGK
jgi:hypothetical protein